MPPLDTVKKTVKKEKQPTNLYVCELNSESLAFKSFHSAFSVALADGDLLFFVTLKVVG